ncbi:unnamed protein product [Clonostachys chloroleuca]|uniref:Uncharacterized protein n=1 Tax=Clonostachys chloroleuca TaxID=1926264 RepID=A0AA35LY48_9HYPO|nr:unnamed protein product [Clonostachys chloroleuca]
MRSSILFGLAGAASAHLPNIVNDIVKPVTSAVPNVVNDIVKPVTAITPIVGGTVGGIIPAVCDLTDTWDNHVLFSGIVGAATETSAAVSLELVLNQAHVEGQISLAPLENFLEEPTIRLNLASFQAYVDIDLSASAGVFQTVTLIASPELAIDLGVLEIDLGAAFALDLVVGVSAAVDLSAGFYISFSEGDYIDLSVVTKQVRGSVLTGLGVKALPLTVGAAVDLSTDIDVLLGLRLRSHISVGADVELLGLDLLNAGAEIAIWADLVQHKITLGQTKECAVSVGNEFGLNVGIAVEVGINVADILDISLAPTVSVQLARADKGVACLSGRDGKENLDATGGLNSPATPSTSGLASPSAPSTGLTTPSTPTPTPSASVTSIGNGSGLVTSTISSTTTYTVTSCHVSVPNCPASQTQVIVTSVVHSTVTVCPATQTAFPTTTPASAVRPIPTITETLTTIVPCEPTSSTFTPPPGATATPVPTVTISDTVTVCPSQASTQHPIPSGGPSASPSVSVPASTGVSTTRSSAPSMPAGEAPTGGAPSGSAPTGPVPTPGAPVHTPSAPYPSSNNTWTSIYSPPASSVPATSLPGTGVLPSTTGGNSPVQPSATPSGITSSAGSLKVGIAMVVPLVLAMYL